MKLEQEMNRYSKFKTQSLPLRVDDLLDHMEKVIRSQSSSSKGNFLTCGSSQNKKNTIDSEFVRAFDTLNNNERIELFSLYMDFLEDYFKGKRLQQEKQQKGDKYIFDVLVREGTLRKSWTKHKVEINPSACKASMVGNDSYNIDFHDFLIRDSKNTDRPCFVLEPCRKGAGKTLRIGFDTKEQYRECHTVVNDLVRKSQLQCFNLMFKVYEQLKKANNSQGNQKRRSVTVMEVKKVDENKQPQRESLKKISKMAPMEPEEPREMKPPRKMSRMEPEEELQHIKTIVDSLIDEAPEDPELIDKIVDQNDLVQVIKGKEIPLNGVPLDKITLIERKKCLDIFHKMMPDYELEDLLDESQFRLISSQGKFRILRHGVKANLYKVNGSLNFSQKQVLSVILDVQRYKLWNVEVELADCKIRINSENSAITYQKHKPHSKFYKPRDFLFLRHVFAQGEDYYIIDKSIENAHYPPFNSIIRGHIPYCLWGLRSKERDTILTMEIEILHEGYLTFEQNQALSLRYLTGITAIEQYLKQAVSSNLTIDRCFDLDWNLNNNPVNAVMRQSRRSSTFRRNDTGLFNGDLCSEIDDQSFYTANGDFKKWDGLSINGANDLSLSVLEELPKPGVMHSTQATAAPRIVEEEKKQITNPVEEDPNIDKLIMCELDSQGMAILPSNYLTKKHLFDPVPAEYKPVYNPDYTHYVWRDEWKVNPLVGLNYIHQKKMEMQKGVLKYVISKMGKNLMSGKGILSVSLPVDIFGTESNLERTARVMGYAPRFLEKAVASKDVVERFKYVIVFALGNGLLGLEMDKPFNPILGQTYQGWLNGCPVFLEQISHHPPIAAFYMQGRGYKIYGNIESRMDISFNSGCGINHGEYVVQFEDTKQKIRFRTPGGQVSGLTFGDRVFNFVGRGVYYDYENQIFGELIYNPTKKGMFSLGKQQKQADYVSGRILRVTPEFLSEFRSSSSKKETPNKKQVLQELSKIDGRWTEGLNFDDQEYFNVIRDVPCILQQNKYPLNSNCHYRQDLIYLKKKDIARSQTEKQRLENFQRADRKLRQKFGKKKH